MTNSTKCESDGNTLNIGLIKKYIKDNKLTIKEFCKLCNISVSAYYRVVNNKNCRFSHIFKISRLMKIRVHQLFK